MKAVVALLAVLISGAIAQRYTSFDLLATDSFAAVQDTSITVTNFGTTAYRINGVNNGPLTLFRGQTVIFNVATPGHPFYIKLLPTTGTGNRYDSGVTGQGVTSGQLTFVIPNDAPSELFYHCSFHSSMGGTLTIETPVGVSDPVDPRQLWLKPATPNPARDGTLFQFGLPRATQVGFEVFDERGRRVRDLSRGTMQAGEHVVRWDGRDGAGHRVASGPYFYRIEADGRRLSGRVVITR